MMLVAQENHVWLHHVWLMLALAHMSGWLCQLRVHAFPTILLAAAMRAGQGSDVALPRTLDTALRTSLAQTGYKFHPQAHKIMAFQPCRSDAT